MPAPAGSSLHTRGSVDRRRAIQSLPVQVGCRRRKLERGGAGLLEMRPVLKPRIGIQHCCRRFLGVFVVICAVVALAFQRHLFKSPGRPRLHLFARLFAALPLPVGWRAGLRTGRRSAAPLRPSAARLLPVPVSRFRLRSRFGSPISFPDERCAWLGLRAARFRRFLSFARLALGAVRAFSLWRSSITGFCFCHRSATVDVFQMLSNVRLL